MCIHAVSNTAFYKEGPVIDFLCEVLEIRDRDHFLRESLRDRDRVRFAKEIKGKLARV